METGIRNEPARALMRRAMKVGALELLPNGRLLKSGRLSPYFFNSGKFTTGADLEILAAAYVAKLRELEKSGVKFDTIFGPAYKGIPLVTAAAFSYQIQYQTAIEFCFDRKEVKDHGEGGILVGADLNGKRVVIIDDVITDGATKKEAVETIKAAGGTPVGLIVGFDRNERASSGNETAADIFFRNTGLPVCAAADTKDLLEYLRDRQDGDLMIKLIQDYLAEYAPRT